MEGFDGIGVDQGFRYVVGSLQLVSAIGLVVPSLARMAAMGLAGVTVGAVMTSRFVLDGGRWTMTPATLPALRVGVVSGRRGASGSDVHRRGRAR